MTALTSPTRLPDLDGLRGWLSLWVVNAHVVQFALLRETYPGSRLAGLLGNGELAVAVFVILSGFVIGRQLRVAPEPYAIFILRRFLRLYPAFLLCFAAGLLLYTALPLFAAQKADMVEHVLLHLSLMHGLVPDSWLPGSSTAFLAPGWSVSVEWQFYLLAPLVAAGLALPRLRWLVLGGCGLLVLAMGQVPLAWAKPSILLLCLHLFLLGMLTDRWLAAIAGGRLPGDGPVRLALAVAIAAALAFRNLPVAAWLLVALMLMPGSDRLPMLGRLWAGGMTGPLARYLGRISYSLYLVHYLVLEAVAWGAGAWAGLRGPAVLPLLYLGALLSVGLADLMVRTVEQPGIRMGRRLARVLLPGTRAGSGALS